VAALGAGRVGHGISRPLWRAQPPMARYSGSGVSDSVTDDHTSLQYVVRVCCHAGRMCCTSIDVSSTGVCNATRAPPPATCTSPTQHTTPGQCCQHCPTAHTMPIAVHCISLCSKSHKVYDCEGGICHLRRYICVVGRTPEFLHRRLRGRNHRTSSTPRTYEASSDRLSKVTIRQRVMSWHRVLRTRFCHGFDRIHHAPLHEHTLLPCIPVHSRL
jgi:hypothetical protein